MKTGIERASAMGTLMPFDGPASGQLAQDQAVDELARRVGRLQPREPHHLLRLRRELHDRRGEDQVLARRELVLALGALPPLVDVGLQHHRLVRLVGDSHRDRAVLRRHVDAHRRDRRRLRRRRNEAAATASTPTAARDQDEKRDGFMILVLFF
jgi:hypothetical protein